MPPNIPLLVVLRDEIEKTMARLCREDEFNQQTALSIWANPLKNFTHYADRPDLPVEQDDEGDYEMDGVINHFAENFFQLVGSASKVADFGDFFPDTIRTVCYQLLQDVDKKDVLIRGFEDLAEFIQSEHSEGMWALASEGMENPELHDSFLSVFPAYLDAFKDASTHGNSFQINVFGALHSGHEGLRQAALPHFSKALELSVLDARRNHNVSFGLLHGWLEAGQNPNEIYASFNQLIGQVSGFSEFDETNPQGLRLVDVLCYPNFINLLNSEPFQDDKVLSKAGRSFVGMTIQREACEIDENFGPIADPPRSLLLTLSENRGEPCFVLADQYRHYSDEKDIYFLNADLVNNLQSLRCYTFDSCMDEILMLLDQYGVQNPDALELVVYTKGLLDQSRGQDHDVVLTI